jgi:thiol-disulfide isomerase/thioredoxin
LDHHRIPTWAKAALLAAIVGIASLGYFSASLYRRPPSGPQGTIEADPEEIAKRKVVTDFILTDAGGQKKKLSDFRGNVVILSFWASWCTPCLDELPTFGQLEKKYHDQGLRILPVNVEEGQIGKMFAEKFWMAQKFTFGSYFDTSKTLAQQFEVDMLPANFVIDRNGRIAFSGFGANDWASSETVEFIESLLMEKSTRQAATN